MPKPTVTKPTVTKPSVPTKVAAPVGGLRGAARPPSVCSSSTAIEVRTAPVDSASKRTNHTNAAAPSQNPAVGHYTIEQLRNLDPQATIKADIPVSVEVQTTKKCFVPRSAPVASTVTESIFSTEEGTISCHACHKKFTSTAAYHRHHLGCMIGASSSAPRLINLQQPAGATTAKEIEENGKVEPQQCTPIMAPAPVVVQGALPASNGNASTKTTNHNAG